ncbi:CHD family protein [Paramicrosporidium saccamoebae]|uniref:CHD family protein n=1 Tax=Paramicrosporidium saccamoebae TaxID=1246581 RepID=A0A2H9TQZ0_9FUNG|nr:CHD family protein [Paramicrosporidium saccamoebae]
MSDFSHGSTIPASSATVGSMGSAGMVGSVGSRGMVGSVGSMGLVNPIETIEPIEPIESIEPIEPIEPIESIESIESIDSYTTPMDNWINKEDEDEDYSNDTGSDNDFTSSMSSSSSDSDVWDSRQETPRKKPKKTNRIVNSSDSEETYKRKPVNRTRPSKAEPIEVSDESESDFSETDGPRVKAQVTFDIPFVPEKDIVRHVDCILGHRQNSSGSFQYLIKWKHRSHLFDSWESVDQVRTFGGGRKLENFLKDPSRMNEEIDIEEFKVVERVLDHWLDEGSGVDYYLCKWMMVPYAECTWEPLERIENYRMLVDEYTCRAYSGGIQPSPKLLHKRCTFRKLESLPEYLAKCGQLRDYQLESVNWLAYSWCHGTNVILADEMGLGKTVQSISYISSLVHEYGFTGPVLVVVPLSTIAAWQREFYQWAPSLNTLLYLGDGKSRGVQRYYEWFAEDTKDARNDVDTRGARRSDSNSVNSNSTNPNSKPTFPLFHVLLTTYELVLKDQEYLSEVDWRMLIVDEGHRLKNADSQLHAVLDQLSPSSRLLVTGTPLQNSILELWSLLHFLMPNKFPDYEEFLEKYGPPAGTEQAGHSDEADKKLEKLHKILKPHLLRRMKKDVETSLPGKVERILRIELSEEQKELSRLVITRNYKELACHTKNVGSLNNILIELKKVSNHPLLVGGGPLEDVGSVDRLLKGSGKLAVLDQLMTRLHQDGHRVLIFSQMVRMLDILSEYLQLKAWKFQRLDGGTSSDARKKSIAAFNAPNSADFCFLLSTRAGGLGINLETADTVIIYDSDWNPQNDLQAMARAHRIGQTRSVNIYRLVSKNSVEETILERAKQKMVLDHLVIQSMDTSAKMARSRDTGSFGDGKKITREELQEILKFGSQDLFNNTGTQGQLDLDEILSRADNLESAPAGTANSGFFDQFKVADFGAPLRDWDEIIPQDEIDKAKATMEADEQRKKDMVLQEALFTSASKRKSRTAHVASVEPEVDSDRRQRVTKKRANIDSSDDSIKLTKSVTRALLATALRFGVIEGRFDTILKEVTESEGDCFKPEHLRHALHVLRRKLQTSDDSCKLSNLVHVNLSQLRERNNLLSFLHERVTPYLYRPKEFQITERGIKAVSSVGAHKWMIEWKTPRDDAQLLLGVHKYGFGNWLRIAEDAALDIGHLKESLVDNADDSKFLPKDLHLGRRVENLLTHMMTDRPAAGPSKNSRKKKDPPEAEETDLLTLDEESLVMKEMKKILKPAREDIAFIASLSAESFSNNLDGVCAALEKIGRLLSNERDSDRVWKYIASVWPTEISGRELKHFYNRISKERKTLK